MVRMSRNHGNASAALDRKVIRHHPPHPRAGCGRAASSARAARIGIRCAPRVGILRSRWMRAPVPRHGTQRRRTCRAVYCRHTARCRRPLVSLYVPTRSTRSATTTAIVTALLRTCSECTRAAMRFTQATTIAGYGEKLRAQPSPHPANAPDRRRSARGVAVHVRRCEQTPIVTVRTALPLPLPLPALDRAQGASTAKG